MINLIRFKTFRAVVETGSFTAAAERLNETRSAISFNIKQLEEELGVTLLIRTTRRVQVTEVGERFYLRCVQILEEIQSTIDDIRGEHHDLRGTLRITTTVEYGLKVVAPALQHFMRTHPALNIHLETHTTEVDLVQEKFDVAIRLGQLRTPKSGSYRGVCVDTFEVRPVIAPSLHAQLAKNGADRLTALAALPRITHRALAGIQTWPLVSPDGKTVDYQPRGRACVVADNASILRSFALQGAGVALLPKWLVNEDLAQGHLIDALPDYRFPRQGVHVLYPAIRHVPLKIRAWVDFLKTALQANH